MMSELALIALGLGGFMVVFGAWLAAWPRLAIEWLQRFPRSRWAGAVLAAVALLWSGWLLYHAPLESFDRYKPLLYALTPVTIVLVILFMDDLLAARALGGLLVLIPAPILDAARWHPSLWRLVVTVICYGMVIKGIALILSPYLFRKWAAFWVASEKRCRSAGAVEIVLGLLVAALGLFVY